MFQCVAESGISLDFRHIDLATAHIVLVEAEPRLPRDFPPRLSGGGRPKLGNEQHAADRDRLDRPFCGTSWGSPPR